MAQKNINDVIVIGAGAAGLMAAITAAQNGAQVLVLEQEAKPGHKLLMTGNGRCNLTHLDPDIAHAYHSEDEEALEEITKSLFYRYGVEETIRRFEMLGLWCHDREGYVYPRSDQAASVLQALLSECARLGVKLKYQTAVIGLKQITDPDRGRIWKVQIDGWSYLSCCVIMAVGSYAGLVPSEPPRRKSKTGRTEASEAVYKNRQNFPKLLGLAAGMGHRMITPCPALTGLRIPTDMIAAGAGARTDAAVTLVNGSSDIASETGQIQWNRDGISGICVMQLSRYASRILTDLKDLPFSDAKDRPLTVRIDFVPDKSCEEIVSALNHFLERREETDAIRLSSRSRITSLLSGWVPDRIAELLCDRFCSLSEEAKTIEQLAELLKAYSLPVEGVRGMQQAQAAAGGIALTDIRPDTMESMICKGLYFAGEILDADGPCGGYNLQWAWSTGMSAGTAAAAACTLPFD